MKIMKKISSHLTAFTMALFLIFAFSACEKEGFFNPKQKIKRIYNVTDSGKAIQSEWTWSKNTLEKIDYYWDNKIAYTERYFYEKNRIVRIEWLNSYIRVTYDGSQFKRIEYYYKNSLETSLEFEYTAKKISIINLTHYYSDSYFAKMQENGFLSSIIPQEILSSIAKCVEKHNGSKGSSETIPIYYKYDGDNIKEVSYTYSYEEYDYWDDETYTYTTSRSIIYDKYDTKAFNPFHKSVELNEFGGGVSSKNLPLERRIITIEDDMGDISQYQSRAQYSYILEKNFPTEVQITVIDEDDNSHIYKNIYEYQE